MSTGKSLYSAQTEATIEPFNSDTVTWVHTGKDAYTIIDNDGHVLFRDTNNIIEDVKSFNHGFSSVKSKGKWGVMNAKGEWVVQPTYEAVNTYNLNFCFNKRITYSTACRIEDRLY